MTKEDIIATAIHEAFRCGQEAGEELQCQYYSMQQEIDAAKQVKSVIDDIAKHDGFMPQVELAKLKDENEKLGKILKEKDATIAELSNELIAAEQQKPAIHWRSLEEKPEDGTWVVYLEETFSQLHFKGETRKYMGKTLSAPTLFRGGHVECVDPMQPRLLSWVPLTDFITDGSLEDVTDKYNVYPTDSEPSPRVNFSVGDEVVIKGEFFEDSERDYPAVIKEVMDTVATVRITAEDSTYYHQRYIVRYEYIMTKL